MKLPPHLLAATLGCSALAAAPASATLNLVTGGADNKITIGVNIPGIGSDNDGTTLTGTIEADLEIDPLTDQVSTLTFLSADVSGTSIALSASGFLNLTSFNLISTTMGGNLFTTPVVPGVVNPATGYFESTQHFFEINEGSISGNVNVLGSNIPANVNFVTDPVGDFGVSPGGVWAVPTSATATTKTYTVVMIMPLNVTKVQLVEGQEVTITANGNLSAIGTVTIETGTLYDAWTAANGITGAPFEEDENSDGVPNGIVWALGLAAGEAPLPYLPVMTGTNTATITFPVGGSAGALVVETSTTLQTASWSPLPGTAVTGGQNPLPAGTTGTVIVTLPAGDPLRGMRLRAVQP